MQQGVNWIRVERESIVNAVKKTIAENTALGTVDKCAF